MARAQWTTAPSHLPLARRVGHKTPFRSDRRVALRGWRDRASRTPAASGRHSCAGDSRSVVQCSSVDRTVRLSGARSGQRTRRSLRPIDESEGAACIGQPLFVRTSRPVAVARERAGIQLCALPNAGLGRMPSARGPTSCVRGPAPDRLLRLREPQSRLSFLCNPRQGCPGCTSSM